MQKDSPIWLLDMVIFCKKLGHGFCRVPIFVA